MGIKVKGFAEFEDKIKRLQNPSRTFDPIVAKTAKETRDNLQVATPNPKKNNSKNNTSIGDTRRAWQPEQKIADSAYKIDNTMTTEDGKHAVVDLIVQGRGAVRPVEAEALFIPLNKKTVSKARKGNWENIHYGLDYVLAKMSAPVPPNDFISPVEKRMTGMLKDRIINEIHRIFK